MVFIQMHASTVLSQDPLEYAPLFLEIADAYFDKELYAEAGNIYETLGADVSVCDMLSMLACCECEIDRSIDN